MSVRSCYVHFRSTQDLVDAAKSAAKEQDRTLSYIIRQALKTYLQDNGYNPPSD